MATKKKTKSKKTKPKKAKSRVKAKKPVVKKTKKPKKKLVAKKKVVARKPAAKKSKSVKKPAAGQKAMPVALPGAERVGIVTHYYGHLSVAIIKLESGMLRTGDTVHIKGHTSDFRQMVGSMELDHVHVDMAQSGQSFGLRVTEHAREHDTVYKVTKP